MDPGPTPAPLGVQAGREPRTQRFTKKPGWTRLQMGQIRLEEHGCRWLDELQGSKNLSSVRWPPCSTFIASGSYSLDAWTSSFSMEGSQKYSLCVPNHLPCRSWGRPQCSCCCGCRGWPVGSSEIEPCLLFPSQSRVLCWETSSLEPRAGVPFTTTASNEEGQAIIIIYFTN